MPDPDISYIQSRRLRLVPATRPLIDADLNDNPRLARLLDARVPDNWPPDLFDGPAMQFAHRQLNDPAERGWSFWYLLGREADEAVLVGVCGFKGRPNAAGEVEIGYSILSQYRNAGYATEAVSRLVEWAFAHRHVTAVTAETLPHLAQSIRVLVKNGFQHAGPGSEHGVIRLALPRSRLN